MAKRQVANETILTFEKKVKNESWCKISNFLEKNSMKRKQKMSSKKNGQIFLEEEL